MPKAKVAHRGLYAYSNRFVEAWTVVFFITVLLQVFLQTIYLVLSYFYKQERNWFCQIFTVFNHVLLNFWMIRGYCNALFAF